MEITEKSERRSEGYFFENVHDIKESKIDKLSKECLAAMQYLIPYINFVTDDEKTCGPTSEFQR